MEARIRDIVFLETTGHAAYLGISVLNLCCEFLSLGGSQSLIDVCPKQSGHFLGKFWFDDQAASESLPSTS